MNLHLITCTRDRAEALVRCAEYVERSTVKPSRWTVVTDGSLPFDIPYAGVPTMYVTRTRGEKEPAHTLPLNLMTASQEMRDLSGNEIIVFWEDDDWYDPRYLEWVRNEFFTNEKLLLLGQQHAPYYRIRAREWALLPNDQHSSLCATAMRLTPETLIVLQAACSDIHSPFVDIRMWNYISSAHKKCVEHKLVVGIKQMPGTPSDTFGWRGGDLFHVDAEGDLVLRQWVGGKDAAYYTALAEREVLGETVG